ncbi:MAG: DUF86 domain-containing protein [Desulfobacterales bacterium]|nr:DUF86 domain-containing protein [Desulfobacterales bacterium]
MREAAEDIENFIQDTDFRAFKSSRLLQAAVERKFEIIGEALNRIKSIDSEFVENITDYRRIISFRNIIAHGYVIIECEVVWAAVKNHLPILKQEVTYYLNA